MPKCLFIDGLGVLCYPELMLYSYDYILIEGQLVYTVYTISGAFLLAGNQQSLLSVYFPYAKGIR